jgi:hypothetical protein
MFYEHMFLLFYDCIYWFITIPTSSISYLYFNVINCVLLGSTSDSTCFMNTCFYCFMILYIGFSPYRQVLYLIYILMYFNVINYVLLGSTSDSTCFMVYVFTVFMFHYHTDMFYILLVGYEIWHLEC